MIKNTITVVGYSEGESFQFDHTQYRPGSCGSCRYYVEFDYTDMSDQISDGDVVIKHATDEMWMYVSTPEVVQDVGVQGEYSITDEELKNLHQSIAEMVMLVYTNAFSEQVC